MHACILLGLTAASLPLRSQSTLSANSGINASDSWVAFDLTIQTQSTTLTSDYVASYAGNRTQSVSVTANRSYHVEAGYDPSGGLVVNLSPIGAAPDPVTGRASRFSMVRYAGGKFSVFDENGALIPIVFPPPPTVLGDPLGYLLPGPCGCPIGGLVINDPNGFAANMHTTANLVSQSPVTYNMAMAAPAGETGSANWTYAYSGGQYLVTQMVFQADSGSSQVFQFANLGWSDVPSKDAARAASRTPSPAATTGPPSGISFSPLPGCNEKDYQLGGPQNIVFQHGIHSDSCTWDQMTSWLVPKFQFGTVIVPTLVSGDPLASQASVLTSRIAADSGIGYILVGHSQGGLIARATAQNLSGVQGKITGVLTVDTPNLGADIAQSLAYGITSGFQADAQGLYNIAGCGSVFDNLACTLAGVIWAGASNLAEIGIDNSLPSLADLQPGSSFLNALNNAPESFLRAGIVSNSDPRWVEFRVFGDALGGPTGALGGRDMAGIAEGVYDGITVGAIIAAFCGDYAEALKLEKITNKMDDIDSFWNSMVAGPTDGSDGIVQSSSQYYPGGGAAQYVINGADSHVGSTRSDLVRDQITAALTGTFRAPLATGCTSLSYSPASLLFGSGGGAQTITITTGAGCAWNALVSAAWLSVDGASSGVGSGSVRVLAQPNLNGSEINSAVQLDFAGGTRLISASESNGCAFTISSADDLWSAAGGSNTIYVSTAPGCVWSAAPDSTWLSINSGQTGTGPGSFTYTAAPNGGSANLVGSISIGDQKVLVTIGDNVGTAATASITIGGSEQDFQYCGYDDYSGQYICDDNYDVGEVSITVAGVTSDWGYDQNTDPETLATLLATGFGAPDSPVMVSALVGSTLYFTSKLTGPNVNFPMSTSASSYYGGYPSFSATLSGSTMTGGH